jgi:S1-C subfamily serine protease
MRFGIGLIADSHSRKPETNVSEKRNERIVDMEGKHPLRTVQRTIRQLISFIVLIAILSATPLVAQACSPEVIKHNRDATVFIKVKRTLKVTGQVEERTGTGFIISPSGWVLTTAHLVKADANVDDIQIVGSIASREASSSSRLDFIGGNEHDVALLKFADTSKTYNAVTLGKVSGVDVGAHMCSEGFPQDKEYFFVEGALSGKGGSGKGGERGYWLTQMPSNPGDSGAPVFLSSGEVIAIKVGGYEGLQDVNLLIPLNLAEDLLISVPDTSSVMKPVKPAGVSRGPSPLASAQQIPVGRVFKFKVDQRCFAFNGGDLPSEYEAWLNVTVSFAADGKFESIAKGCSGEAFNMSGKWKRIASMVSGEVIIKGERRSFVCQIEKEALSCENLGVLFSSN